MPRVVVGPPILTDAVAQRLSQALRAGAEQRLAGVAALPGNPARIESRAFGLTVCDLIDSDIAHYHYFNGPRQIAALDDVRPLADWFRTRERPIYVRLSPLEATEPLRTALADAGLRQTGFLSTLYGLTTSHVAQPAVVEDPRAVANDNQGAVAEDPRAVANEDQGAVANDQRAFAGDPRAFANDPQQVANDPRAVANDQRAFAGDPRAFANDPRALANDPQQVANDPRALATEDHGAVAEDPRAFADDPQAVANEDQGAVAEDPHAFAELWTAGDDTQPFIEAEFSRGWRCFVARADGVAAAYGALFIAGNGVGVCAAAATLPPFRGRGLQTALLRARIAAAAHAGCDLVVAQATPGSTSQRNMQRVGLALAYTSVIWTW